MYKVVFDDGKPSEEEYATLKDLENGLRAFFIKNDGSDYPFDAKVYDEDDNDISESQLITEMINEITEVDRL